MSGDTICALCSSLFPTVAGDMLDGDRGWGVLMCPSCYLEVQGVVEVALEVDGGKEDS